MRKARTHWFCSTCGKGLKSPSKLATHIEKKHTWIHKAQKQPSEIKPQTTTES